MRIRQAYEAISEVLASRASLAGRAENMDDTITALSLLLEHIPNSHSSMAALYDQYGCSLLARWRDRSGGRTTVQQDLDDAVAAYHRSLELTPDGDLSSMNRLRNLAAALEERFVRDGSLKDLKNTVSTAALTLLGPKIIQSGLMYSAQ